ncbi:GIY-YIG nuclease family protein [Maricaulis sp.]|uniref:GIY-YIG nuclease family protein n=1 Tax=Maricaulis sp. TaxID=1486257 RepID=UPI003A9169D5
MVAFMVQTTCPNCGEQAECVLWRAKVRFVCSGCQASYGEARPLKGFVYVAFNERQPGFAKVGLTTKDPEQRMKEISRGAGSIGTWKVGALFHSNRPEADEKRCHDKLKRFQEKSEVFCIDPVEAMLKVRTALSYREPLHMASKYRAEFDIAVAERRQKARHLQESDTPEANAPDEIGVSSAGEVKPQRGLFSNLFG